MPITFKKDKDGVKRATYVPPGSKLGRGVEVKIPKFKRSKRLTAKDVGIDKSISRLRKDDKLKDSDRGVFPLPGEKKPVVTGKDRDQFRAQYRTGGIFFDDRNPDPLDFASPRLNIGTYLGNLFGGLSPSVDEQQIELLRENPLLRSEAYNQSLRRVADAGNVDDIIGGSFNFDSLFSPVDPIAGTIDRGRLQDTNRVLLNQNNPNTAVITGDPVTDSQIIEATTGGVNQGVTNTGGVFVANNAGGSTTGTIYGAQNNTANLNAEIDAMGYDDNSDILNDRLLNNLDNVTSVTNTSSENTGAVNNPTVNPFMTPNAVSRNQTTGSFVPSQIGIQNTFPSTFLNTGVTVPRDRATTGLLGGLPFSFDVGRFNPLGSGALGLLSGSPSPNAQLGSFADQFYNLNVSNNLPNSSANFLSVGNIGPGFDTSGDLLSEEMKQQMIRDALSQGLADNPQFSSRLSDDFTVRFN